MQLAANSRSLWLTPNNFHLPRTKKNNKSLPTHFTWVRFDWEHHDVYTSHYIHTPPICLLLLENYQQGIARRLFYYWTYSSENYQRKERNINPADGCVKLGITWYVSTQKDAATYLKLLILICQNPFYSNLSCNIQKHQDILRLYSISDVCPHLHCTVIVSQIHQHFVLFEHTHNHNHIYIYNI